jgi:hypothetical protein
VRCAVPSDDALARRSARVVAGAFRSCSAIRLLTPMVLAVLALSACGMEPIQRQPVSSDDGLHMAGRVDGKSLNVSHGEPDVTLGPCDAERPQGRELCIAAMGLDGGVIGLVVQNPDDLVPGESIPVRGACAGDCEGVALVELQHDVERILPTSGELVVRDAGERFAATFTLRFPRGTLTGVFDVDPSRRR